MKQCPACGSGRVHEYHVNGVWAIECRECGYDSGEKERERERERRERERREKERNR